MTYMQRWKKLFSFFQRRNLSRIFFQPDAKKTDNMQVIRWNLSSNLTNKTFFLCWFGNIFFHSYFLCQLSYFLWEIAIFSFRNGTFSSQNSWFEVRDILLKIFFQTCENFLSACCRAAKLFPPLVHLHHIHLPSL